MHPWRYARDREAGVGLPYLKGSGGRSPATPALYEEESLAKKALSISELEAQSAKEEEEDAFLEQRARRNGFLVAMFGAALMVLAVVLGAKPW